MALSLLGMKCHPLPMTRVAHYVFTVRLGLGYQWYLQDRLGWDTWDRLGVEDQTRSGSHCVRMRGSGRGRRERDRRLLGNHDNACVRRFRGERRVCRPQSSSRSHAREQARSSGSSCVWMKAKTWNN